MERYVGHSWLLKPTLALNTQRCHVAIATGWGSAASISNSLPPCGALISDKELPLTERSTSRFRFMGQHHDM